VAENSVLLGYDAASMGDRFPTFRKNIFTSSSMGILERNLDL